MWAISTPYIWWYLFCCYGNPIKIPYRHTVIVILGRILMKEFTENGAIESVGINNKHFQHGCIQRRSAVMMLYYRSVDTSPKTQKH